MLRKDSFWTNDEQTLKIMFPLHFQKALSDIQRDGYQNPK